MKEAIRTALVAVSLVLGLAARATASPAVMVLYFDNNTSDPAYAGLSKGLADMMTTDLASVPGLQVVERDKLEALLTELKLQKSKYFDARTAQRLGKGVGAAYAVTGAFLSVSPTIRIDVRVVRVDTAAVVKAASVTGNKDDFFNLQSQLTARLVEGLSDVIAKTDAHKLTDSARNNRVTKLSALVDYGDGLDAHDRGDLTAASRLLQKVVSNEPSFALGKQRYTEIMKALYRAKDRREDLLSTSEKTLLAHTEEVMAKDAPTAPRRVAYRVFLGQYYLERIRKAVDGDKPVSSWVGDIRAYVANQEKLFAETQAMAQYSREDLGHFSNADEKLADELGVKSPGQTFFLSTPADMMRESANVVMQVDASNHHTSLGTSEAEKMPCPFTLDPSFGRAAIGWYKAALVHIAKHDKNYAERETMRTLRELATALALVGRTEEGIAQLQSGLDKHPKSDEFKSTEDLLRSLLSEPPHTWCKAR